MELNQQGTKNLGNAILERIPTLGTSSKENASDASHPSFAGFSAEDSLSFIRGYDPKAPAISGFRHAVIRFKMSGTDKVSKPAQMATIPQITLPEDSYLLPDNAAQVLIGILEDQQDTMIRAAILEGAKQIKWVELELNNCLVALTAVRVSQRLTREGIENWFNVSPLFAACKQRGQQIAEAKGYTADVAAKQIAGTINAYRSNYGKLAAAVPNLGMESAQAIQTMLISSGASDDIAASLKKKLHTILNPVVGNDGDL